MYSDFASDRDTCLSVTGFMCSLSNGPVAGKAKQHLSSEETEFVATSICGQEAIHLRSTLLCFGNEHTSLTKHLKDNPSCNPENSGHIDTLKFFLCDKVRAKVLRLQKVDGTENVADALTKSVPEPMLEKHC